MPQPQATVTLEDTVTLEATVALHHEDLSQVRTLGWPSPENNHTYNFVSNCVLEKEL